jgi:hypothetical protein
MARDDTPRLPGLAIPRGITPDGASAAEETPHFVHGLLEPAEPLQGSESQPDAGLAPTMPVPTPVETARGSRCLAGAIPLHSAFSPPTTR